MDIEQLQGSASPERDKPASSEISANSHFQSSLMGVLIGHFRSRPGPRRLEELVAEVAPILPTLRRTDGSEYSDDAQKAVLGCLSTAQVFVDGPEGWTMSDTGAEEYERRMLANFKLKETKRKVNKIQKVSARIRHKRARRAITIAERISTHLHSVSPEFSQDLSNPLRNIHGTESLKSLKRKLGHERLLGLLQGYALFSSAFAQLYPDVMRRKKTKTKKHSVGEVFAALENLQNELER